MAAGGLDQVAVRLAAFAFLEEQVLLRGEVLPVDVLRRGFVFDGYPVPLMGPQGIFKPAVMDLPISMTTVPVIEGRPPPYDDEAAPDGFWRYRYRGTNPFHHENAGLRTAMQEQIPLVYFYGIVPGQYLPQWPRRPEQKPNEDFLAERYELFRAAG